MHIEVFTDGSATTADKPGGWAFVLVVDGAKHSEGSGYMPNATNNDAEMEAAIQGLKAAFELPKHPYTTLSTIELVSDSQLILGWANGTKSFSQAKKIAKYKELKHYVYMTSASTRWVEGHTGNEFNERCDELANIARKSLDKPKEDVKEKFRWNRDPKKFFIWDVTSNKESEVLKTNKQIINSPAQGKFENILRALCEVVSELMEIEEKRK